MKQVSKFIEKRLKLFTQLADKRKLENQHLQTSIKKIKIQLGDKYHEGDSNTLTPFNLLKFAEDKGKENPYILAQIKYLDPHLGQKLVDPDQIESEVVPSSIANQDNQWDFYDLSRPLISDCEVRFLTFEDSKSTFWHSSSHILGSVIEEIYPDSLLTMGPSVKEGFFYDFFPGESSQVVHESNYQKIQQLFEEFVKKKYDFERLVLSKDEALELFGYNKFKTHLIQNKVPDGQMTSVYKIGDFIDLCSGPHIPTTYYPKGFGIVKHSSAYWLGDSNNESLQRIYGISFPTKKQYQDWQKNQEDKAKRDHRVLGLKQKLFFFNKLAPGSAFFKPHGAILYNKLIDFLRNQYISRGYQEVITPNLFHVDLWKTSGHYKNYKENLFLIKHYHPQHNNQSELDHDHFETHGLKPMNCPAHCLMFKHDIHSYKELPIRFADFGVLHRNEITGALSGLTRVRRFQQDDAHIFCTTDQIESEVKGCLDFLEYVYGLFGFKWEVFLSTRPPSSMGSDEIWDQAENQLKSALDKHCQGKWKLNKGDGAFYGPKIDIVIYDAMGRAQQCGTIQLDFQLPIRFNLQYKTDTNVMHQEDKSDSEKENDEQQVQELSTEDFEPDEFSKQKFVWKEYPIKAGNQRPVIIHRAILGSVERFLAIITESLNGKWPLWLSPRQVIVCSVTENNIQYANQVSVFLKEQGFQVSVDDSNDQINKKVRNATIASFNYIAVVGEKEQTQGMIDIRTREGERLVRIFIHIIYIHIGSKLCLRFYKSFKFTVS